MGEVGEWLTFPQFINHDEGPGGAVTQHHPHVVHFESEGGFGLRRNVVAERRAGQGRAGVCVRGGGWG